MQLNTLVIGGTGYIGSQLMDIGRRLTVLGRGVVSRYELPSGVDYVAGDFAQYDLISTLLDKH